MLNARPNKWFASGLAVLLLAATGTAPIAGASGVQATAGTSATTTSAPQVTFNQDMQTMRAQMMQLRATSDPAARAKLLDEHMRTMQGTLHMMMGQGGVGGVGGMGPGMMPGRGMRGAGGMMANGQMMRMMMDQMMQHQQAMQAMGCTGVGKTK